jgi:hypothetical protein
MEKLIIPSILFISDVIPLSERILKITQQLTESDVKVKDLHTNVSRIYERLVKNQKNTGKSRLTEELILLDKRRDRALIALRDIIHGMSVSLPDETSTNAAKLYAIIDKYGAQIYKLGYKAETAMLISLFNEFDLAVNQKLLTGLNIGMFYESLKAAQIAFDAVSQQRSEEINVKTNESEAATQILEEMFPALISLVAMIQLYYQLEPAKYGTIYNQLNTYITEVNTTARARKTRKQKSGNTTAVQKQAQS